MLGAEASESESRREMLRALWAVRRQYSSGLPLRPERKWILVLPGMGDAQFWAAPAGVLLNDIIVKGLKTTRGAVELIFAASSAAAGRALDQLAANDSSSTIIFSKDFGAAPWVSTLTGPMIVTDELNLLVEDRDAKKKFWEDLKTHL